MALQELFPEQPVNILELLYLEPEKLTKIISQQIAEMQTYNMERQVLMTEETIRIYLELTKETLLFTSNFTKLYRDNIDKFDTN